MAFAATVSSGDGITAVSSVAATASPVGSPEPQKMQNLLLESAGSLPQAGQKTVKVDHTFVSG